MTQGAIPATQVTLVYANGVPKMQSSGVVAGDQELSRLLDIRIDNIFN